MGASFAVVRGGGRGEVEGRGNWREGREAGMGKRGAESERWRPGGRGEAGVTGGGVRRPQR